MQINLTAYDMKKLLFLLFLLISAVSFAQQAFDPAAHAAFRTDRSDGRFTSSRAIIHQWMQQDAPVLAFRPSLSASEFSNWQHQVKEAMQVLMKHPAPDNLPAPIRLSVRQRDGYRIEKWEAYPLPGAAVPYLVLIPEGVDAAHPVPAVLCIPGWGGTKEELAGEPEGAWVLPETSAGPVNRNAMARLYAEKGLIAVAVDNPGSGEAADLENIAGRGTYDYLTLARALLEMDWSYLGYASYIDRHILNWMKQQPAMQSDRLIVSGFSFGTEMLMALGCLDSSLYAFVYNDFLCRTRERALVMTYPDSEGKRPWPNDISHLIPGFLRQFDFPDLVAALAPHPVICTEGGLDRDFRLVRQAYSLAGKPENFTYYHYKAFAEPGQREDRLTLPEGIDRDTYFRMVHVDPQNHYFKAEYILPWIQKITGTEGQK